MRPLFQAIAIVAALGLAAYGGREQSAAAVSADGDPHILLPAGDAMVAKAREDARRTLPIFWSKFEAKGADDKFDVKVALPAPDGSAEVIWMRVEEREGNEVIGLLNNQPVKLANLQLGSRISADVSLIDDWSYVKNGKAYGHYSTRAMLERATPEMRAQAMAVLAPTALEDGAD